MSDHTITLNLPQHLYERLNELAQTNKRPIESVAIEQLSLAFDNIPDLSAFIGLSDDQLWAVVNTPFDVVQDNRMKYLREQRETRPLTDKEEVEADDLIEAFHVFILNRSKAMLVLQQRGVDVMSELSGS
ncbi:MAG: hypothetical protein SFZ02_06005 [bacterium]|nr:hypothetical protein [bacterium]